MKRFWAALALIPLVNMSVWAHPVSFKDGYGIMPEHTADHDHLELNYSLTSRAAVGFSYFDFRMREDDQTPRFYLPRFNYRLYRRNEIDSQGNIYLSQGVGVVRNRGESDIASFTGMQADWETRRVYTLASVDSLHGADGTNQTNVRTRFGVAPYLADFEDFHTFLIAQIDYSPDLDDEFTFTPVVRVFYDTYLAEIGVSHRGELFVSGIFHF